MDIKNLRPAKEFALQYGFKAIIFGPPGSGKTPISNTAPRPVMLATEPGLLSMRGSNVPTWLAPTPEKINEFFDWFFNSNEVKNFDTIVIDSISQMAEVYLQSALASNKHGLKAYGEMATETIKQLRKLYFTQQKHTYLIAKEEKLEESGIQIRRPYMPGKQLPIELPHMYDAVLHLAIQNVPGMGQIKAFRCQGSMDVIARDRTGSLAEFEPPDFGALVRKAMS